MKILVITQHFFPEQFRVNDVVSELVARGNEVTVITNIPNYPTSKRFPEYGFFHKRRETVFGARVIRTPQTKRDSGSGTAIAFNYLTSFASVSWRTFFNCFTHRYDAVLVHETSPVTIGLPGVIAKRVLHWFHPRKNIPFYFWVLDLWPESLKAASSVRNPHILGFFASITRHIYRNSTKILISSRGFRESIVRMGNFADKLVYFPNWADKDTKLNVDYKLPEMPDGFIVMFAGNIGEAQDFEHVMEAAKLLKDRKNIHFVFVGDGRKRAWVEQKRTSQGLEDTVHLLGYHPMSSMPLFFQKADVMLVCLNDSEIFSLTAPAKFQTYMNAGKPIIAMLNGEGQKIIDEAECGLHVPAGDSKALAEAIVNMSLMPSGKLLEWGSNGKKYCDEHFNLDRQMNMLTNMLEEDQGKK
jgi:glycosyltransferase involved in cell wall biosynthesis